MQDEVAALVPESRSTTSWGTPALDLGAGVRAQLAAAGVEDVRVVATPARARTPAGRPTAATATPPLRFAGVVWRHS